MTMTEDFYLTNKNDHTTYGGKISIEDFNTYQPTKQRIISYLDALQFDKDLKRRKEIKKYSDMTLEELREMKIISNTDGRPSSILTDEKWQKEFAVRKTYITPYPSHVKKMAARYTKEFGKWNEETHGTYHGATNYQEYCSFINDILSNIRMGQVDYCYFIYQIMDLTKFHFHDLMTRYCDGYWEVWLKNK